MKQQIKSNNKNSNLLLIVLAVVVYLAGTVALFLIMGRVPQVEYAGDIYALTDYKETFTGLTFTYESPSGNQVTGERCLDCCGVVVTDSAGNAAVCWLAVRGDSGYVEEEYQADGGCNHEVSGMDHDQAFAFMTGVKQRMLRDGNVWSVSLYWALVALVAAFVLYKKAKGAKAKMFGDSIYTVILVMDVLFAAAILYDAIRI